MTTQRTIKRPAKPRPARITSVYDTWTEAEFQESVIETAQALGWRVHAERHAWSRGKWSTPIQGDAGWPDLILVKAFGDCSLALVVELKRERARQPSTEQLQWLRLLGNVAGIMVAIWRPSDMDTIRYLLSGSPDIIKAWKSPVPSAGSSSL